MTRDSHAALCALADALHERAAARLQALRDEEARLRAALTRLDTQADAARDLPQEALRGVREIGADIVWEGWLARHRAALRDELARVLASKEEVLPAQKRAFGKAEAARALRARVQAQARRGQARQQARLLDELGVMARIRAAHGDGPGQVS